MVILNKKLDEITKRNNDMNKNNQEKENFGLEKLSGILFFKSNFMKLKPSINRV
mgnify:CR=1 FL=1